MIRRRGFTLIELLIVLSILVILAAIGMENYLAAQIRAKITRNRAEFRTLATGIEMYAADHNVLPRMTHWSFYQDPAFDRVDGRQAAGIMSHVLSTPVAYVSRARLIDPFMERNEMAPIDERVYTYQVLDVYVEKRPTSQFWRPARAYYGGWRLGAVGPDQVFDHGFINSAQLPYDPTNGLVSFGNLWHSPRRDQEGLPPIPTLLGEH